MIKRAVAGATLALLFGLSCVGPALAAEGRSLSLSASRFSFSAEPGQKGTGEVIVMNDGTGPVSVRVYVADQVVAPDGSATFVVSAANGDRLKNSASWLTFKLPPDAKAVGNIPYIEMPVGNRLPVNFEVVVPDGAPPGDRQAVLFFEMFSPEQAAAAGTARINARIGARIKTRVKGEIIEKLDVRPFTMPAFVIGSSPEYSFTVRNEGNIDQTVDACLVALDRSENEVGASEVLTDTPVYASTVRETKGVYRFKGLAVGPQRVRLTVSYTGDSGLLKSVQKDRTVWAAPLWLLVAVATVLAMLILAGVWVIASRSAEHRMQQKPESDYATRRAAEAGTADGEEE